MSKSLPAVALVVFFIQLTGFSLLSSTNYKQDGHNSCKQFSNDFSTLNKLPVKEVRAPASIYELQELIKNSSGPVSIAGAQCSMGGQTIVKDGIVIDMRNLNKIISCDSKKKIITVQAGATWKDVQSFIDPYNLSVKVMQSYCDFSVGGSLGVNIHGRYKGFGPIIETVQKIKIVLADGSLVVASRKKNKDLFYAAIGGYGLLGVIVEVTLALADNVKIECLRNFQGIPDYFNNVSSAILSDKSVILHNGTLYPPDYTRVMSVTWCKTDNPVTIAERLKKSTGSFLEKVGLAGVRRFNSLKKLRYQIIDPIEIKAKKETICWRNYEAGLSIRELYIPEMFSVMLLQEYFIPLENCQKFIEYMRMILQDYQVNVINISIRHIAKNIESILSWSTQDSYAFVLYYEQKKSKQLLEIAPVWNKQLINKALQLGGTYYLPYQLYASKEQFHKAYPRYQEFEKIKYYYDPKARFQNCLWQAYF